MNWDWLATLNRQYKSCISDFKDWKPNNHAKKHLIYPQNISKYISIDETIFTNGELYTIVTSKESRRKKESIVVIIKGLQADQVNKCLSLNPKPLRDKEITLEMSHTTINIAKGHFQSKQFTGRFHLQKLGVIDKIVDKNIYNKCIY